MADYAKMQREADAKTTIEFVPDRYGRMKGDFMLSDAMFIFATNFGGPLRKSPDGRITNSAGNRNFNVIIPSHDVDMMRERGWTIKEQWNKDENKNPILEDGPCYYMKIKVKAQPPESKAAYYNSKIYRCSGGVVAGPLEFDIDPTKGAGTLDDAANGRLLKADLSISRYDHPESPYPNGQTVDAQLIKAAVFVEDPYDPFDARMAAYMENNKTVNTVGDMNDNDDSDRDQPW